MGTQLHTIDPDSYCSDASDDLVETQCCSPVPTKAASVVRLAMMQRWLEELPRSEAQIVMAPVIEQRKGDEVPPGEAQIAVGAAMMRKLEELRGDAGKLAVRNMGDIQPALGELEITLDESVGPVMKRKLEEIVSMVIKSSGASKVGETIDAALMRFALPGVQSRSNASSSNHSSRTSVMSKESSRQPIVSQPSSHRKSYSNSREGHQDLQRVCRDRKTPRKMSDTQGKIPRPGNNFNSKLETVGQPSRTPCSDSRSDKVMPKKKKKMKHVDDDGAETGGRSRGLVSQGRNTRDRIRQGAESQRSRGPATALEAMAAAVACATKDGDRNSLAVDGMGIGIGAGGAPRQRHRPHSHDAASSGGDSDCFHGPHRKKLIRRYHSDIAELEVLSNRDEDVACPSRMGSKAGPTGNGSKSTKGAGDRRTVTITKDRKAGRPAKKQRHRRTSRHAIQGLEPPPVAQAGILAASAGSQSADREMAADDAASKTDDSPRSRAKERRAARDVLWSTKAKSLSRKQSFRKTSVCDKKCGAAGLSEIKSLLNKNRLGANRSVVLICMERVKRAKPWGRSQRRKNRKRRSRRHRRRSRRKSRPAPLSPLRRRLQRLRQFLSVRPLVRKNCGAGVVSDDITVVPSLATSATPGSEDVSSALTAAATGVPRCAGPVIRVTRLHRTHADSSMSLRSRKKFLITLPNFTRSSSVLSDDSDEDMFLSDVGNSSELSHWTDHDDAGSASGPPVTSGPGPGAGPSRASNRGTPPPMASSSTSPVTPTPPAAKRRVLTNTKQPPLPPRPPTPSASWSSSCFSVNKDGLPPFHCCNTDDVFFDTKNRYFSRKPSNNGRQNRLPAKWNQGNKAPATKRGSNPVLYPPNELRQRSEENLDAVTGPAEVESWLGVSVDQRVCDTDSDCESSYELRAALAGLKKNSDGLNSQRKQSQASVASNLEIRKRRMQLRSDLEASSDTSDASDSLATTSTKSRSLSTISQTSFHPVNGRSLTAVNLRLSRSLEKYTRSCQNLEVVSENPSEIAKYTCNEEHCTVVTQCTTRAGIRGIARVSSRAPTTDGSSSVSLVVPRQEPRVVSRAESPIATHSVSRATSPEMSVTSHTLPQEGSRPASIKKGKVSRALSPVASFETPTTSRVESRAGSRTTSRAESLASGAGSRASRVRSCASRAASLTTSRATRASREPRAASRNASGVESRPSNRAESRSSSREDSSFRTESRVNSPSTSRQASPTTSRNTADADETSSWWDESMSCVSTLSKNRNNSSRRRTRKDVRVTVAWARRTFSRLGGNEPRDSLGSLIGNLLARYIGAFMNGTRGIRRRSGCEVSLAESCMSQLRAAAIEAAETL